MACGGVGSSGMVAVVRGLPNSGLAVTLHDGTRQYTLQPDLYGAERHSCSTSTCKNTAEASTEVIQKNNHKPYKDSVAQVSDDRFTSTYQVTHCRVIPTSSPVELTEFPPQAQEPCRGYDNFIVGGTGSGQRDHSPVRVGEGNFKGGGMVWPNRGSVYTARPSKELDSFANSLRKYPNLSPDRSLDFVERLINYTQTKNIASTRTSPTRQRNENITAVIEDLRNFRNKNNSSKNMQTYTRTAKGSIHESPTRDVSDRVKIDHDGKNYDADYDYMGIRKKDKLCDLEASNQKKGYNKALDVRYLCDMTKSIRERIRQMCDETQCGTYANDCPMYRDRLNDHRRKCRRDRHNMHENKHAAYSTKSCGREATVLSEGRATVASCSPSTSYNCRGKGKSSKFHARNACLPAKSLQTSISSKEYEMRSKESYNSISDVPRTHTGSDATYPIRNKIIRRSKSEELVTKKPSREKLHKVLRLWLNEIPVNQYETEEERSQREQMIVILEDKLINILEDFDGDELDKELRSEINKTLRDLPMWYPEDRCEQDAFFGQIINNLIRRVQENAKGPYQNFCSSSFVVARSKMQCNVCHDVFRAAIINWVNDLPLRMQSCDGRCLDKSKIVKDLEKLLRPLAQNRPNCNNMYQTILRDNIMNFMKDIPLSKHSCNKQDQIQRLAQKLVDLLVNIKVEQKSDCCGSKKEDENNLKESIKEEVYDVLKHAHVDTTREERTEAANEISSILMESMEVMRAGNDDEVQNHIVSIVHNMHDMSDTEASAIAGNIIHKAHDLSLGDGDEKGWGMEMSTPKRGSISRRNLMISDMSSIRDETLNISLQGRRISNQMADQISHWLVELPLDVDASQNIDREKQDLLSRLERTIHNDEAARNEIEQWLGKMPIGKEYDNKKTEMANKLITRIKKLPIQTKSGRISPKESSYLDSLRNLINNWVDNLPFDLKLSDMKDIMVNQLATEIADRQQYLEDNPSKRLNQSEEDSYLEYQIYRWLYKVPTDLGIGSPNELVEKFGNNVLSLIEQVKNFKSDIGLTDRIHLPYVEKIQQEISNWTNQLPPSLNLDKRTKDKFSKELAEEVDRCQRQPEQGGNIDNIVEERVRNTFEQQDVINKMSLLKELIKAVPFQIDKPDSDRPDPDRVASHIKLLEKRLGEWLTLLPIKSNPSYESHKSEMVKEMAIKLKNLHAKYEDVQYEPFLLGKVTEELADFLTTVPLDPKRNAQRDREEYANMMLPIISNLSGLRTFRSNNSSITNYRPPSTPGTPYRPSISNSPITGPANRYNDMSGFSAEGCQKRCLNTSGTCQPAGPSNKLQRPAISNAISAWCKELPVYQAPEEMAKRESTLMNFVFQLFQGVWAIAVDPKIMHNDVQFRNVLRVLVSQMIDSLPSNPELENVKGVMAEKLVNIIIQNKGCFTSSPPSALGVSSFSADIRAIKTELYNRIIAWCHEVYGLAAYPPSVDEHEIFVSQSRMIFDIFSVVFQMRDDPNIFSNKTLLEEMIAEEVLRQIEDLPQTPQLSQHKREFATQLAREIVTNIDIFLETGNTLENSYQNIVDGSGQMHRHYKSVNSEGVRYFSGLEQDRSHRRQTSFDSSGRATGRRSQDRNAQPGYVSFASAVPANSSVMSHGRAPPQDYASFASRVPANSSVMPRAEIPPQDYDSFASGVPANSSAIHQRTLAEHSPAQRSQSLSKHTSLQSGTMQTFEDTRWSSQLTPNPESSMYMSNQQSYDSKHYTTIPDASFSLRQSPTDQPSVRFTSYQGGAGGASQSLQESRVHNTLDQSIDNLKKMLTEEIVEWCNGLPAVRSPEEQKKRQHLQFALLLLVFRKAHELAANPDFFDDNDIFEELMAMEIESLLETIPNSPEIQADKWMLSVDLAKKITNYKAIFEKKNRTQLSLMNRTEEAPSYQSFQRRAELMSTPKSAGIENRNAHWFSPHGEAQNASQDLNMSAQSGMPSPILRSPQQGRAGGGPCNTCRDECTTCPHGQATSTPVSSRQYEGGGVPSTPVSGRQYEGGGVPSTPVSGRQYVGGGVPSTPVSGRQYVGSGLASTPVSGMRFTPDQPGQMTQNSGNFRTLSSEESKPRGGYMFRMGPQMEMPFSQTMPDDSYRMHRTSESVPPPYSSQSMPSGMPRRKHTMDMSEDSASGGESRDEVGSDMNMRCRCRERAMAKCPRRRKNGVCMRPSCAFCNSAMFSSCPQCCNFHCPYPSRIFFS